MGQRRWLGWGLGWAWVIWAFTTAPLCSLSCNGNRAKTFKEDQICPVLLSLDLEDKIYNFNVLHCNCDQLHCNFRALLQLQGDKTCNFNLLHSNFKEAKSVSSINSNLYPRHVTRGSTHLLRYELTFDKNRIPKIETKNTSTCPKKLKLPQHVLRLNSPLAI
ncbi:Alanine racemase [Gossypium arboreum]|uniref:Alanine racemase n=1 Tax=Gossypium arboreum TaxID=29729 RepID=A0A0B0PSR4_GOSAR|nr:Alanine racemase [Gossypium arboreum]